jgi:hypothetical protein
MKKLTALAALCLTLAIHVNAQEQDTTSKFDGLKDTSALMEITPYAGVLTAAKFNADSGSLYKWASVRAGGILKITNKKRTLAINAWGIFHNENVGNPYTLSATYLTWNISKKWKLSGGHLPSATAEFRPNPATGDGQFETFTEALLPGVRTGGKINYVSGITEVSVSGTVNSANNNNPMLAGKIKFGDVSVGGSVEENNWSATAKFDTKHFTTIAVGTKVPKAGEALPKDYIFSNFFVIKTNRFDIYSDMGFNLNSGDRPRGEWGIIKNFKSKDFGKTPFAFSGLVAIGWQNEVVMEEKINTINLYLFMHL